MKRSTKHSLLLSILALVLCTAMLLGTTFAWFTDTASTAVNTIQAGTLQVGLQMKNESGDWVDAEGETLKWQKAAGAPANEQVLWEPGCTYKLPEVKVVNNGNLALNYTITINGVQGNAKLLDAIDFTVNGTAVGSFTLNGMLLPGAETDELAISGHMRETAGNEYQGLTLDSIAINVNATQATHEYDSFNNTYDKDAVTPVNGTATGNLAVSQAAENEPVTVKNEQIISDGVMEVTYPNGVKLVDNTNVEGTGDNQKATVEQKLVYVSDTPSNDLTNSGVSIGNDMTVAHYELTLPVARDNTKAVTIKIKYATGLSGVKVYHAGVALTADANANGESFTYNPTTGELTLTLMHASPIDILNNVVSLPENAKVVNTLADLEAAVGNLHDGDYIAFGANIVQDKVDTTSGQITFARASDATGNIVATLDLNGHVFDGQIGGFSFANDGITVNVLGYEKAVADYYEHETGHHMVKACAVFNYSGATVLKKGYFESNNIVVMAYGGEVVVQDGTLHNNSTEPDGAVIYACNDPAVTIDGGTFSCEDGGAIFVIEPYRTNKGPVVTINGGVFDASKAACFLCVDGGSSDADEVAQVIINGGTFKMPTPDGDWAQDNDGTLATGSNRLIIRGGTFNVDPSAYVDTTHYNVTHSGSTWTVTAR